MSAPVAIGLAALVVLMAALLARRAGARSLPPMAGARRRRPEGAVESRDSVSDLDRQAEIAAREGDHAAAVRLRFRAGLQRLAGAKVIELRPSLTAGEVARKVHSPHLDRLTSTFERVTYGNVQATEKDSSEAQSEWPAALRQAGLR